MFSRGRTPSRWRTASCGWSGTARFRRSGRSAITSHATATSARRSCSTSRRRSRALQIPADVLYLDIDYQDRYRQFTWNAANFPSPAAMNAALDGLGFQRVNIFDACLVNDDPLRGELAGAGLLLKDAAGQPITTSIFLGDVSWIDFTMPAARSAYRPAPRAVSVERHQRHVDRPERACRELHAACDLRFRRDPRQDFEGRNLYAMQQAKLFEEAQLALRPNVRPWVLSRAGYTGIHRYAGNWAGTRSRASTACASASR